MNGPDSLQGALPLMVLKILSRRGPLHGYGITARIEEISEEMLSIEEGSLYPALHRMEESGWVSAKWMITENKRRARISGGFERRLETGKAPSPKEGAETQVEASTARAAGLARLGEKILPDCRR